MRKYDAFRLEVPMFNVSVEFLFGSKEMKRYAKAHSIEIPRPAPDMVDYGVCQELVRDGEYKVYVWITDDCPRDRRERVLVHELSHCVTKIINSCFINDDEFRSYMLDWLYSEGIEWLRDKVK